MLARTAYALLMEEQNLSDEEAAKNFAFVQGLFDGFDRTEFEAAITTIINADDLPAAKKVYEAYVCSTFDLPYSNNGYHKVLFDILNFIEYLLIDWFGIYHPGEIQLPAKYTAKQDKIRLIDELNTPNAKHLLKMAVDAGLCDADFKWQKSKALCAYFSERACNYLGIGKGVYYDSEGIETTKNSWQPFEALFGINRLVTARNSYKSKKGIPSDSDIVDKLFESLGR